MRQIVLGAALLFGFASTARADLTGVTWAPDTTADGLDSGTLGTLGVTLTSTDGGVNGGDTFTGDWPDRAGTMNVPGIAGLVNADRTAIDWNTGLEGVAIIAFTGGSVTNPVLLFDFTDPGETFQFPGAVPVSIIDQSPAGSVTLAAGNTVTLNGTPGNGAKDSFALQLMGTYSSISFNTNLALLEAESVGFTVAADLGAVPEPSSLALVGVGLVGLIVARRRRA
jgi:hypothetical protein